MTTKTPIQAGAIALLKSGWAPDRSHISIDETSMKVITTALAHPDTEEDVAKILYEEFGKTYPSAMDWEDLKTCAPFAIHKYRQRAAHILARMRKEMTDDQD